MVLVLLFLLFSGAAAQCANSATSDSIPTSPDISGSIPNLPLAEYISPGCSEVVKVYDQGHYNPAQPWPRVNCPHLAGGLTNLVDLYPSLAAGANVTIASGSVLVKQCWLPAGGGVLFRITVKSGATLVFDDSPIDLNVREIIVESGGAIKAGLETCRYFSPLKITFHGTKLDSSPLITFTGPTTKGMVIDGLAEFHGKQYHPTWTRLARTANPGTNLIFLQHRVNWEVGQEILITTSAFWDCPSKYQNTWCKPCSEGSSCTSQPHQNEIRTISAIYMEPAGPPFPRYVLQLNASLSYKHYAGREYQVEVALLSRRFLFTGSASGDSFGGHTMIEGGNAEGRFSGIQGLNMGQLNVVGRYPFHFHMMGDSPRTNRSYFQDCSIKNSFFRCFVVHGTSSTRLSRNVGYNADGFCFYLEDGVEERNLFEYNLAAHVHPIKIPADGGGGQGGEPFYQSADLFLPADVSASGFYIPNAYNSFIGNAASGGWSGFAFPNVPGRLGNFKDTLAANSLLQPINRPLLKFLGNTCHSTGFYWDGHGSCVYVGAWFFYEGGTTIKYDSGRHSRKTYDTSFSPAREIQMVFEDTKCFLCNKGIAHWGDTVTIKNYEAYDIRTSAMLFGDSAMDNALIVGRTSNHPSGNNLLHDSKMGFQFYDTWVKTILTNCTFRNFSRALGTGNKDTAVRYMDHSDHYIPQGINSVNWLRFEDVPADSRLGIANCGPGCGLSGAVTMSSKIYSVWDWDGSFTQVPRPTIMGGNKLWWNWDNSCVYRPHMKIWTCDWRPRQTIAFLQFYTPVLSDGADYAMYCTCGTNGCPAKPNCVDDQYAPYTVGYVNHWGRNGNLSYSLDLGPWPGVSGLTGTGWHWRVKAPVYGVDGPPSWFKIGGSLDNLGRPGGGMTQIGRGHFVVLSIAYPSTAQFSVKLMNEWRWTAYKPQILPMAPSLAHVLNPRENLYPTRNWTCVDDWPDGVPLPEDRNPWWAFCMSPTHGGVGPAWFFDGTHLYVRIVNLACYNRNQMGDCYNENVAVGGGAYFENHNTRVPEIFGPFSYEFNVTSCAGCSVHATVGGVNYYTHPDSGGPPAFPNPDWGTVANIPLPTPKPRNDFQCPAALYQAPGSSSTGGASSSTGAGSSTAAGSSSSTASSSSGPRSSSSSSSTASSTGPRSSSSSSTASSSSGPRSSSSSSTGSSSVPRSSSSSSSTGGNQGSSSGSGGGNTNTQSSSGPTQPTGPNTTPGSSSSSSSSSTGNNAGAGDGQGEEGLFGQSWLSYPILGGAAGGLILIIVGLTLCLRRARRMTSAKKSAAVELEGHQGHSPRGSASTRNLMNVSTASEGNATGAEAPRPPPRPPRPGSYV